MVEREGGNQALQIDLAAIRKQCEQRLTGEESYEQFASLGIEYRSSFQVLKEVHTGASLILAVIRSWRRIDNDRGVSGKLDHCRLPAWCRFPIVGLPLLLRETSQQSTRDSMLARTPIDFVSTELAMAPKPVEAD